MLGRSSSAMVETPHHSKIQWWAKNVSLRLTYPRMRHGGFLNGRVTVTYESSHGRGAAKHSEINISPKTRLRRNSFPQPDQHFCALVLKPLYWLKYQCNREFLSTNVTGSSSREELHRSETFGPKRSTPTVG